MTTATLKEITEKLGIEPDDVVTYHEEEGKGIIEFDFTKINDRKKKNKNHTHSLHYVLNRSEDIGVKDWSMNHDHYLYGTSKRESEGQ